MRDHLAALLVVAAGYAGLWWFTRRSTNRYIRWQWRRPGWILLRWTVFVLALHGVFWLSGFSTLAAFAIIAGASFLLLIGSFGPLGFAVVVLGGLVHEWIFWFPSRRHWVLRLPRRVRTPSAPRKEPGKEGTALTDLRPGGVVLVDGIEHQARSVLGFVDKGEPIRVEEVGDFELLVRRV